MPANKLSLKHKWFELTSSWGKLNTENRIILGMMLVMLFSLPFLVILSFYPTKLFSRAFLPATPPVTLFNTPTPNITLKHSLDWVTDTVYLTADDFRITSNNTQFTTNGREVNVQSDPGDPTYTTLEAIWYENGVEMRLFMYFHADSRNWWMSEMRTYNGNNPGDWIYYYNVISPRPLGTPFYGNYGFGSSPSSPPGQVYFEHLVLLPFRNGVIPSVTPAVTSTPTLAISPVENHAPRINSSGVKIGRKGKAFSVNFLATDHEGDSMSMNFSSLPAGLSLGSCNFEVRGKGFSQLKCPVSGIPRNSGAYTSTQLVKDQWGLSSVKKVYFVILP